MVLIRRDIWELETDQEWHPITLAYAEAVRALRQTPIGDVSVWAYQAAIHGSICRPNRLSMARLASSVGSYHWPTRRQSDGRFLC